MRSTWNFSICNGKERLKNNGTKVHSTQKPETLLYRIILASSNKNDFILDPFLGSGTTALYQKIRSDLFRNRKRKKIFFDAATVRIKNTHTIKDI